MTRLFAFALMGFVTSPFGLALDSYQESTEPVVHVFVGEWVPLPWGDGGAWKCVSLGGEHQFISYFSNGSYMSQGQYITNAKIPQTYVCD